MKREDALEKIFANPEKYGCSLASSGTVLDAGVHVPGGWMAGRALVLSLYGCFADVSFGQMTAAGQLVPTLDVFLDNTVKAAQTLSPDGSGAYRNDSSEYRFVPTAALPPSGENTMAAAPHSLVSHLFSAGTALPREVRALLDAGFCAEEISWGFSSVPVVLRTLNDDDASALQQRVLACGQLVSVWLRGADEELKHYLETRGGPGELRLHNLLTGNTFVGGKLDEDALAACLL